jgi:glycerate-2-kinase
MVSIERMRADALAAFEAAVDAARPENLVPAQISRSGDKVSVCGEPLPETSGRHVVISIGKAAPGLTAAWLTSVPGWADQILVLTPHGVPVPAEVEARATILRGAHPYPDADGEASTRRLLEIAEGLGEDDVLVVLLSGGGSALMAAAEEGLELDDVHATTKALLKAGAAIDDVNTVRRQLLAAAGGGLARAAHPASVRTLIISDVLGDPLADIASGPTVPSSTTVSDALAVLDRFGLHEAVPGAVTAYLRAASGRVVDDSTWAAIASTHVIGNNRTAVDAAAAELAARSYDVTVAAGHLEGEASERGRELAAQSRDLESSVPSAVVLGGETTVTVNGSGRGGRNQELALAAALELVGASPAVILAAGTDGIDGLSDNAGAIVDSTTIERLRRADVDPVGSLADNDSATALAAIGDEIRTGPTGTNVCDVTLVLTAPTNQ